MMFSRTIPVKMRFADGPVVTFEVTRMARTKALQIAADFEFAKKDGDHRTSAMLALETVTDHLVSVSSETPGAPDVPQDRGARFAFVDMLPSEVAMALFMAVLLDGDPSSPKWTAAA